jgi:hypothetical protein
MCASSAKFHVCPPYLRWSEFHDGYTAGARRSDQARFCTARRLLRPGWRLSRASSRLGRFSLRFQANRVAIHSPRLSSPTSVILRGAGRLFYPERTGLRRCSAGLQARGLSLPLSPRASKPALRSARKTGRTKSRVNVRFSRRIARAGSLGSRPAPRILRPAPFSRQPREAFDHRRSWVHCSAGGSLLRRSVCEPATWTWQRPTKLPHDRRACMPPNLNAHCMPLRDASELRSSWVAHPGVFSVRLSLCSGGSFRPGLLLRLG